MYAYMQRALRTAVSHMSGEVTHETVKSLTGMVLVIFIVRAHHLPSLLSLSIHIESVHWSSERLDCLSDTFQIGRVNVYNFKSSWTLSCRLLEQRFRSLSFVLFTTTEHNHVTK